MKKAIGISTDGIQIAELAAGGAMPKNFAKLGNTYKDSATFETAEGDTIACECEELDDPEDEIQLLGETTLKYATTDFDPEICHKAFGGTLSEDKSTWTAPDSFEPKEVAVKFQTKTGLQVVIGRGKMFTRMNWAIKKDGYGTLEHTIKVLTPTNSAVKKLEIIDPSLKSS